MNINSKELMASYDGTTEHLMRSLSEESDQIKKDVDVMTFVCHRIARHCGWWDNPRNDGELIALMHSELSEALEGLRKDKQDDHLPNRKNVEVELADCIIRILDFAGARNLDIGGAICAKLAYNLNREDHKRHARQKPGGKSF